MKPQHWTRPLLWGSCLSFPTLYYWLEAKIAIFLTFPKNHCEQIYVWFIFTYSWDLIIICWIEKQTNVNIKWHLFIHFRLPAIPERPLCHPRSNKSSKTSGNGKQSLGMMRYLAVTFSISNSLVLCIFLWNPVGICDMAGKTNVTLQIVDNAGK